MDFSEFDRRNTAPGSGCHRQICFVLPTWSLPRKKERAPHSRSEGLLHGGSRFARGDEAQVEGVPISRCIPIAALLSVPIVLRCLPARGFHLTSEDGAMPAFGWK